MVMKRSNHLLDDDSDIEHDIAQPMDLSELGEVSKINFLNEATTRLETNDPLDKQTDRVRIQAKHKRRKAYEKSIEKDKKKEKEQQNEQDEIVYTLGEHDNEQSSDEEQSSEDDHDDDDDDEHDENTDTLKHNSNKSTKRTRSTSEDSTSHQSQSNSIPSKKSRIQTSNSMSLAEKEALALKMLGA
jgi:hypothetical protein